MTKIKLFVIGMLCAFALMASVKAEDNWVMTLAGNGNTTLGSDGGTAVGGELGIGRTGKILLPVEAGLRQGFAYTFGDNNALFDTKVYFDVFPIKFKRFEVGAGVNAGSTWGNTPMVWSAAPEGVVRFYIKEDVAIFGRVEYPFDLGNNELGDRLNYVVGLMVRF